jgi:tRNA threonylcarbamoyl adenosine modification protein YeaZ
MPLSLCITSDYDQLHITLVRDGTILNGIHVNKHDGNKALIPSIMQLLAQEQISLAQIVYIAVNVGPAPYTSLRIVLATMNGVARATHLPIVEIDALAAYSANYGQTAPITVALLNAFNRELFFAIAAHGTYTSGYCSVTELAQRLAQNYPQQQIVFYGNGFTLYKDELCAQLGNYACYDATIPTYPPVELLAQVAHEQWLRGISTNQARPRYLKEVAYQNSIKTG